MDDLRLQDVLEAYSRTQGVDLKRQGSEYHGPCPVENAGKDRFWAHEKGGKVLMGCRSCPDANSPAWFVSVLEALGLKVESAAEDEPPKPIAAGCSLAALARRTALPVATLESLDWSDVRKVFPNLEDGASVEAVKMPYYAADGSVSGVKYRIRIQGPDHYRWKAGSGARLLGEDWLVEHDGETDLVLVEGETDYATLRHFGIRCAALPGSKNCGCLEARHLEGCDRVLVVAENDAAGQKFPRDVEERVRELGGRMPVLVVRMPAGVKDTNELYQKIPKSFDVRFRRACRTARGVRNNSKVAANPTQYRPWTVPEIFAARFEPTRWVIPDLLPEGLVWIMGSPKCGKSWFAYELAVGVATGRGVFAKWHPNEGHVLYLDLEQKISDKTRFRLNKVNGLVDHGNLVMMDDWPLLAEGGIDELRYWLEDDPKTILVVIDVAASIWPSNFKGNTYDAEYKITREINRLAEEHHCCLFFVHHDRKAEGASILDAFSGSRARVGAASALMWMIRDVGESTGKIGVTGRTGVVETVWSAHFDDQRLRWTVHEELQE